MQTKNMAVAQLNKQRPFGSGLFAVVRLIYRPVEWLVDKFDAMANWLDWEMRVLAVAWGLDNSRGSARLILEEYAGREVFWMETEEEVEPFADEPIVEHPPVSGEVIEGTSSYRVPENDPENKEIRNAAVEEALDFYMDFTLSLYESLETDKPLVKPNGLLQRGTKSPWTKEGRDGNDGRISEPIKRVMREVIDNTEPTMYTYDKVRTSWRLNLESYPTFEHCASEVKRIYRLGILD